MEKSYDDSRAIISVCGLEIEQDLSSSGWGLRLWPAAVALAGRVGHIDGPAIDMGCGVGLTGLVLARRVPVTFNDIDPEVLSLVGRNMERNGLSGAIDSTNYSFTFDQKFDHFLTADTFGVGINALANCWTGRGVAMVAETIYGSRGLLSPVLFSRGFSHTTECTSAGGQPVLIHAISPRHP